MLVQEPVQAAIWHCLNHYAYSDATFLAERLFAEVDTDDSLFLVATCYYRAGKVDRAHHTLQKGGARTSNTKFLLARCAADLNRDAEAESTLRGTSLDPLKDIDLGEMVDQLGDKAAFALQILSGVYSRSERNNKSVDADKKALKLNPFLWKSFESLCNKGESVDVEKVFQVKKLNDFASCHGVNPIVNLINSSVTSGVTGVSRDKIKPTPPAGLQTPCNTGVAGTPLSDTKPLMTPNNIQPSPNNSIPCINVTVDTPGSVFNTPVTGMETPLLYCNSISSTPLASALSSPGHGHAPLSGIATLNNTSDSDGDPRPTGLMPPPIRPKIKTRFRSLQSSISSFSPSFGILGQTPSPNGLATQMLEFSSPQMMLLSPFPAPPILNLKQSIGSQATPSPKAMPPLPQQDETRHIKRVAMATKAENQKVLGLVSQPGNVITPSPGQLPPRRSSRLFGSTNNSVKENSKALNKNRITTKSPSRKSKTRLLKGHDKHLSENEKNERNRLGSENQTDLEKIGPILDSDLKPEKPVVGRVNYVNVSAQALKITRQSADGLMELMRKLGAAYQEIGRYNCRKAVSLLDELPPQHQDSGWVNSLKGKCHFELAEYKEAKKFFGLVRERDPYRLAFMEYYSTALWHLQEEVELSALAQDLTRIDKFSAASWCAAGNCFSHQKEHENAIKFFQRAVQVEPRFAYAYTLLGHEYVLVEELDKALSCFRTAVRIDHRHYNSWYGIGLTYYKQERFPLAEIYYRKALAINPSSPILMCHVAVVQHALKKTDRALETLNTAIACAPRNPLCKFERASILHSSERYQEALVELNELKEIVPKESPVYFLIGKVHNKLGNTHHALMHFSWAMDLDPKGANSQIKDALDPSLNRAAQDGGQIEDQSLQVEPMIQGGGAHEDFQGDVSEDFRPGENMSEGLQHHNSTTPPRPDLDSSSPVVMPPSPGLAATPTAMVLNDSDDSL